MKSFLSQRLLALFTVSFLFMPASGLAASLPLTGKSSSGSDSANKSVNLKTVDVTGSRTKADSKILPQGTVTIDHKQIEQMPATNLTQVLQSVGGVHVSPNYYGGVSGSYAAPDIMGFGATASQNTLILLNGRRLNTVDSSAVNLGSIPLSAIDHLEIIPGAGSVLYGSGAVGGVINVVTRKHYGNHGHIEGVYGENNTRGGNVQGSFGKGNVDGIASVGRLLSDNYRENNRSAQTHAFGDLRYVNDSTAFYLTAMYEKEHLGAPGVVYSPGSKDPSNNPTSPQLGKHNKGAYTPDDWVSDKTLRLLPGLSYAFNDKLTLHLDTGFRVRKQYSDYVLLNSMDASTDRTVSVSPRLTGHFLAAGIKNQWTAGADYFRTHYNSDGFNGKEYYERTTRAVYAQDSLSLTESTWLTLGVRHTWLRTTKQAGKLLLANPDNQTGLWNVGIKQALSDSFALFAGVNRSARYATMDELRPLSSTQEPLQTQTGKTYRLGAKWMDGQQYSTLTLWQGKYHHEIAYDPMAPVPGGAFPGANINLDPTKRQGVSLNSYWKLDDNLYLAVSGSWQKARFDGGRYKGNNVPLVPRITGYVRVDWQALASLSFSLSEHYQGNQYMDNDQNNDFGKRIPSYHLTNLSATYRPTGRKSVYVTALVHNLGNKRGVYNYASTATYLNGPQPFSAYPLPGRYYLVKTGVDF